MDEREAAAREFAKLSNLKFFPELYPKHGQRLYACIDAPRQCNTKHQHVIWIPEAGAPAHVHFEFLGWVIELLGPVNSYVGQARPSLWHVSFTEYSPMRPMPKSADAADLSLAALQAGARYLKDRADAKIP